VDFCIRALEILVVASNGKAFDFMPNIDPDSPRFQNKSWKVSSLLSRFFPWCLLSGTSEPHWRILIPFSWRSQYQKYVFFCSERFTHPGSW
jgi:hypothetical protein